MSSAIKQMSGAAVIGAILTGMTAGGTLAADGRLKVVTSFTILADMAQNVAGDAAEVVSITKPGADIHEYEPTPRDLVRGQGADLLLSNGLGLELWFDQFLRNLGDIPNVTLSDGVGPISISGGEYDGKPNPHAWMGLDNGLIYITNIENALSEHDPDNAAIYAENAENYRAELQAMLGPLRDRLGRIPEENRILVTCEGAFSYLARDFAMRELFLWPVNADQMGTPRQVQRVIDGVRENQVPAVFCESTVNPAPAQQVARETGAEFGGVLYVDSLSDPDGPVPGYLDLLRVTAETIAEGLAPE